MKNTLSVLLLMVLGLSVLLISSCAKPTVPNFEEYGIPSSVWDYEHVVWFDLNYVDQAKGSANVDIWMSVKGENPNATLKIVSKDIVFDEIISYSEGKIYHGGNYELLNLDQAVTYEIKSGENTYTGEIAKNTWPQKVLVDNWPVFDPDINYSPSWTIPLDPEVNLELDPELGPDLHVIDADAYGEDTDIEIIRQIEGTKRTYTLDKTIWNPIKPIEGFYFSINAIGYEMVKKNKVLVVGVTGSYYDWYENTSKDQAIQRNIQPFRFMDQIQQDINK